MKQFLIEWKNYGFKIAFGNWLIGFTKHFIGAKRIEITYKKKGKDETKYLISISKINNLISAAGTGFEPVFIP